MNKIKEQLPELLLMLAAFFVWIFFGG